MTQSFLDEPQESADSLHPAFIEALTRLVTLGDQPPDDPAVRDCLIAAILHAPRTVQEALFAEYRKHGLLPTPDAYTQDGQGLHDLEKVVQQTGLPVKAIRAAWQELAENYPDAVLSDEARKKVPRRP